MRARLGMAAAAVLAGCGPDPLPTDVPPADCVALFQRFDAMERYLGTLGGLEDRFSAHPELMQEGRRIQRAGCLTFTNELSGMESVAGPPVVDSGPAIIPTSLHAGVVTDMAEDARALAFFEAAGVQARSVGSAPLGRRIYLGPFRTGGALASAAELARRAGFASPYPADF